MADTESFNVVIPQLGETVTEGTITQWFKKVGDQVAEDEPLFEVSTDKVDTEVAFAGMTEQAARDAGHDVSVSKHSFNANSRALIIGEPEGMVKVIAQKDGPILGVHMVGAWVTAQLGEGWLSVNWEATPDDMGQLIHPHPTLSETFGETVLSLTGRGLHG